MRQDQEQSAATTAAQAGLCSGVRRAGRALCGLLSTSRVLARASIALVLALTGIQAHANTCSAAGAGGTAPSDWRSYCWLDFSGFSANTANNAAGQNFSFTLGDGSTLTLNVRVTNRNVNAVTAPSWSGAAVGNSAYTSIPGLPVLYTTAAGNLTITLRNIAITPPGGVAATAGWAIVAADAESSNQGESITYTTNGGTWTLMQNVPAATGSTYPTLAGVGTTTVTETGVAGTVGSYVFSSGNSPTTVSTALVSGGLQGVMFAVRYAWVSVNKSINGTRLSASDQFTYSIKSTASGTTLVSNSSTGAGAGPFTAAQVTVAAGYPVTVAEVMAPGSASALSSYTSSLTCTNANVGSATVMPTAQAATSVNLGTLAYGDGVTCVFTNTAKRPSLTVVKGSEVLSDPVNGATNPKRIPGSVIRYTVNVTNSGPGTVDSSTVVITDALPSTVIACVSTLCGSPIVEFIDGATTSGLAFNYATNVTYSNTVGGGAPYTYTPVPDASGFDAAVTGIRIAPTGLFAAAGSGNPSFSVRFRAKVK
jgi:uncharacterized repeat protein (TIGR01451 family)